MRCCPAPRRPPAPNRGRATAVAANVASLNSARRRTRDAPIYNGAGKQRPEMSATDRDMLCRSVASIATAAACNGRGWSPPPAESPAHGGELECLKMDAATSLCVCRKTDASPPEHRRMHQHRDRLGDSDHAPRGHHGGVPEVRRHRRAFRTPSLLNIAETAPYFHSGLAKTLEEVLLFYNEGGGTSGFVGKKSPEIRPLGLTEGEIAGPAGVPQEPDRQDTGAGGRRSEEGGEGPGEIRTPSWDWSKNIAKPPLTGLGGSGAGGAGARGWRGRRGAARRARPERPERPVARPAWAARAARRAAARRAARAANAASARRAPPADSRRAAAAEMARRSSSQSLQPTICVSGLEVH